MGKEKIFKKYEKAKQIRLYSVFGMCLSPYLITTLLWDVFNKVLIFIIVVLTFLIFIYIYHKYWRCPICDKPLPDRDVSKIEHCPKCGEKITGKLDSR